MQVPIELNGHKGFITSITGKQDRYALHPENMSCLQIFVLFPQPVEGLGGFAFNIPAKSYTKDELFDTILLIGSLELAEHLESMRNEKKNLMLYAEQQAILSGLALAASRTLEETVGD